jgi:cyclic pyranopterin phosphate synthase
VNELSHLDDEGAARMVDVSGKPETDREAVAEATVSMTSGTRDALFAGDLPKGDALALARIAAITGVKRTPDLVPLCHPIPISAVEVGVEQVYSGARIEVRVRATARTGVEMEAMTGAALGAIAIYDMVKGLDRSAEIGAVRLLAKSGGRSGEWRR